MNPPIYFTAALLIWLVAGYASLVLIKLVDPLKPLTDDQLAKIVLCGLISLGLVLLAGVIYPFGWAARRINQKLSKPYIYELGRTIFKYKNPSVRGPSGGVETRPLQVHDDEKEAEASEVEAFA